MPEFSILILTYNSAKYLGPLFESLTARLTQDLKTGRVEIIVVDNASSDNTASEIKKYIGENTHFIENGENSGYAKGVNLAAKKAKGKYLVVINPDARLKEIDLHKISQEFESRQNMAIAGFPIIDEQGNRERNAGKFYNPLSFLLYSMGFDNKANLRFSPSKKTKVDYVSGGFVIFRKDIFEKLKGYDEDYFMYVEDMDISFRAKKMGFETYFLPYATIVHKGQGSSSREFAIINIYKGLQLFFKKHSSFIMQLYISSLLSLKAATIIFLGAIFGKKDLVTSYSKALKTLQ